MHFSEITQRVLINHYSMCWLRSICQLNFQHTTPSYNLNDCVKLVLPGKYLIFRHIPVLIFVANSNK